MRVVIPSMSRSKTMTSHQLFTDYLVCVPESQMNEYRQTIPEKFLVPHSDSIIGLMKKVNWIYDNLMDDEAIFIVDDDLTGLQRLFVQPGEDGLIKDPELIQEIVWGCYQQALDLGVWMFGFETTASASMYYDGLQPFSLKGYINGCASGMMADCPLRIDERLVAKSDYDVCLMNAYVKRILFKNLRYAFSQPDTFVGEGGQSQFRTRQSEENDMLLLKKKYGAAVKIGAKSGVRKRDYAGTYKTSIVLPY